MADPKYARYVNRQKAHNAAVWRARRQRNVNAWRRANPEATRAHRAVYRAIQDGTLTRPDRCEKCDKSCKPEASHTDYEKQLEVEWLCRQCHVIKDYKLEETCKSHTQ